MDPSRTRAAGAQTVTVALLAALLFATASSGTADAADAPRAGRTLLAEHDLPRELLDKMASFKPSAPQAGESVLINAQIADTIDWLGPPIDVAPKHNPYVLAVTVKGRVRADGDVATLWRTGWVVGDALRAHVLPGLSRSGLKGGASFEARAVGMPLSFKEARSIVPTIGMVSAGNLDITAVHVEVWSGLANPSWKELLFSMPGAAVGITMLALLGWWRR